MGTGELCGAKTRAGNACRRFAMRNGRCSLHGGKSLKFFAHPNYKHGLYSKYSGLPEYIKLAKRSLRRQTMRRKAFDGAVAKMTADKGSELTVKEITQLMKFYFPV